MAIFKKTGKKPGVVKSSPKKDSRKALPSGSQDLAKASGSDLSKGSERRASYAKRGSEVISHGNRRVAPAEKRRIRICFDRTASSQPFIDNIKKLVSKLLEQLIGEVGDCEVNLGAWTDYGLKSSEIELFRESGFSDNVDELLAWLKDSNAVEIPNDWDEAVETALAAALSDRNLDMLIIIGDAPPHHPGYPGLAKGGDAFSLAGELGERKVPIFAFRVGDAYDTEIDFKKLAELSGGEFGTMETNNDSFVHSVTLSALSAVKGAQAVLGYTRKYDKALPPSSKVLSQKLLGTGKGKKA